MAEKRSSAKWIYINSLAIAVSFLGLTFLQRLPNNVSNFIGILMIVGCVAICTTFAIRKRRHPAFGLLGLLHIIGIVIVVLIPEKPSED